MSARPELPGTGAEVESKKHEANRLLPPSCGHLQAAVLYVKRIADDRAVARVRVGLLTIDSLWILGLTSGQPQISWPQTKHNYPIVAAAEPLRSEIERLIFAALAHDQPVGHPHKKSRRQPPLRFKPHATGPAKAPPMLTEYPGNA